MTTLSGIRIIELAGIGPAPFAGMMLADHGAEVIRIDRPGSPDDRSDVLRRGRKSIALDLKRPESITIVRDLARSADGVIEGFRPGVMERLGLGPDVLLADNPRLAYGRMTGWGQTGPLSALAGHDINYAAISGVLGAIGRAGEAPVPPLNLVADFGGGGMLMAFAMTAAILHARGGGTGQVIDCAMTEGASLLMAMIWGFRASGRWHDDRGANLLDTGAPFYEVYACSDGGHVALGSIEPQFYAALRAKLGLGEDAAFDAQFDRARWPVLKARLAALFATRTRAEWEEVFAGADLCFAPVLTFAEAPVHPHAVARGSFVAPGGVTQPAPAPRFSVTPAPLPKAPRLPGADAAALLRSIGYDDARIAALTAEKVIGA
ncbi:CaiB/BaiF CoA-transferase family protein [Sphingomonas sp.]|jgi:alpha-methylacyl-CoA racemase|uniref:CaiB/BaiF CoA transferase family protein n=1 Tax=Sphingomonas sp. TaxID=28214 RepID=UPI002EDB6576